MKILAVSFLLVFFLIFICPAQKKEVVSFANGTLTRPGSSHIQPQTGYPFNFKFLATDTDVNGIITASSLNVTEIGNNCCFYGKKFVIADFAEGIDNFRQGTSPVIVGGTSYSSFFYRGTIRFNGSALVPFYLKKKNLQVLKIQITVTGNLKGYATLADRNNDTNALFNQPLSTLKGLATYTIRRHDIPVPGMENHFDIVSVTYDLTP